MSSSLADPKLLELVAKRIRRRLLELYLRDQAIHLGSSLSVIEILTVIIFKYMRRDGGSLDRDRLVLSKGHAAPALYVALAEQGLIPREELYKMHDINGVLQGHPEITIPGVDASTGSLASGFSFAVGLATAIKMRGGRGRVFVVMGDGEQDEGEVWEAMSHAAYRRLDNLVVVIDNNGYQLDGPTDGVKPKHYMPLVWRAVGWNVLVCDGHDVRSIDKALSRALQSETPSVIFAYTTRMKGVPLLEGKSIQRPGVDVVREALLNA
ncbi:MAG: transketolase [Acidilobaceae archaeon]